MNNVDPEVRKDVCYTFEVALEKAIIMEERGFRNYLHAINVVEDRQAKAILREAAREELEHKQRIELALLEGHSKNIAELKKELPTLNLNYVYEQKEITADADARTSLAYAIHLEKCAVDFIGPLFMAVKVLPWPNCSKGCC